jgi:Ni/Co efflux regulator RcnB
VHDYYRKHGRRDKCPPGLAKKRNGCQAPGQARKWSMGRPLPRDVAYQPVEAEIRVKLGVPPAGHEFVRVASDILLIAVGTSIVMDAIQDINGR